MTVERLRRSRARRVRRRSHAQPAPQSDGEFHITAWAPKPTELPPYVGVNRPHWKLAELLAAHRNDQDSE